MRRKLLAATAAALVIGVLAVPSAGAQTTGEGTIAATLEVTGTRVITSVDPMAFTFSDGSTVSAAYGVLVTETTRSAPVANSFQVTGEICAPASGTLASLPQTIPGTESALKTALGAPDCGTRRLYKNSTAFIEASNVTVRDRAVVASAALDLPTGTATAPANPTSPDPNPNLGSGSVQLFSVSESAGTIYTATYDGDGALDLSLSSLGETGIYYGYFRATLIG